MRLTDTVSSTLKTLQFSSASPCDSSSAVTSAAAPEPPSCNSHCLVFLPFKCLSKIIIIRNRIKTDFLPKYVIVHTRNLILLVFKYIRCLQIPQRQPYHTRIIFSKSIRFKAGIKSCFSSPTNHSAPLEEHLEEYGPA